MTSQKRELPVRRWATTAARAQTAPRARTVLTDPNNTILFVSKLGDGLTPGHLTDVVRRHVKAANIGKTGSCHLFRRALATLLLAGGADVRMVKAMLGHASLNTTALYTHVAIRALKEVHERTHHGARLGKRGVTTSKGRAAELLAALESEQAEEEERSGAVSAFDEEPVTG